MSLWHLVHCWHATGAEETRHKIDYFCNRIMQVWTERECCKCGRKQWKQYKFWC
jgi:hypothetical protein